MATKTKTTLDVTFQDVATRDGYAVPSVEAKVRGVQIRAIGEAVTKSRRPAASRRLLAFVRDVAEGEIEADVHVAHQASTFYTLAAAEVFSEERRAVMVVTNAPTHFDERAKAEAFAKKIKAAFTDAALKIARAADEKSAK